MSIFSLWKTSNKNKGENKEMLVNEIRKKLYKDPEWLYQKRYDEKQTYENIGKIFGVCAASIRFQDKKFEKNGNYLKKWDRWTQEELNQLKDFKQDGKTLKEISILLNRTLKAVKHKSRLITNEQDNGDNFLQTAIDFLEEKKNEKGVNDEMITKWQGQIKTLGESIAQDLNKLVEEKTKKIIKSTWTIRAISEDETKRKSFEQKLKYFINYQKGEIPELILNITDIPDYTYKETNIDTIKEMYSE
jgi:hypothetical protein